MSKIDMAISPIYRSESAEQISPLTPKSYALDTIEAMGRERSEECCVANEVAVDLSAPAIEYDSYMEYALDEIFEWSNWILNHLSLSTEEGSDRESRVDHLTPSRHILTAADREKFQKCSAEINLLFDKICDLLDEEQFEKLMYAILLESMQNRKEGVSVEQEQAIETYRRKTNISKERLLEANKMIEAAKKSSWWGHFEEVASTMGLTLAASMTTGTGGWGVVAMVYALGVGYNRFLTDYALEKGLAKNFSQLGYIVGVTSKNSEHSLTELFKIGSGLINCAIMISLGGAQHWLGTLLQGTMQMVNVQLKVKTERTQGRLFALDEKLKREQSNIANYIKRTGKGLEAQSNLQRIGGEIARQNNELVLEILRGS